MTLVEELTNISIYKDDEDVYIFAKDQCWSDKVTQNELLSIDIILSGILPIKIIPRTNNNPLLQIGSEDDGVIHFNDSKNPKFDAYWAPLLIDDIRTALNIIEKRGQMKFHGTI